MTTNSDAQLQQLRDKITNAHMDARMALQQISAHEAICIRNQAEIRESFNNLYKLLWRAALGTISILLVIAGTLILALLAAKGMPI
jgi:hypothetical protein